MVARPDASVVACAEQFAGAAVADRDPCARHRPRVGEARHPREAAAAAPLEVHRHVGDERASGDVARPAAAEQRRAQSRRGELDDVEAVSLQRDADDLERARVLAADGEAAGRRVGAEQRRRARRFDVLLVVGARRSAPRPASAPRPCRGSAAIRRRRRRSPPPRRARRSGPASRPVELGLHRAHRHRQDAALGRLDDAEARRRT